MYFEQRLPLIQELGFDEAKIPKLKAYIDLLWSANDELNLFSRKMPYEELIDNHVIDCLLPLKHLPKKLTRGADFGAGGGLPGVIYAIHFASTPYLLFEKSPKKQDFLRRCKEIAPNLEIHGEIPHDLPGVELVTARAFKPVDVILDMSRDYFKRNGRYFLLKGRLEKIDEELGLARKKFKTVNVKVDSLKSPVMEVERHLVTIN